MAAGLARERRPCFVYSRSLTRDSDLQSKLLTLGNADASTAFRSLTRNSDLRSKLLTLGNADAGHRISLAYS